MKCPFCSVDNTRVIDSRPADDGDSIRRRRQCDACGRRFTTYEKVETIPLIVIKKDKNRETYDRRKIEAGVIKSCHKRPVSAEAVTKCIDDIENEIFNLEVKEVDSTQIGEIVMDKIKDLDQVAYVRFASVYREFNCSTRSLSVCHWPNLPMPMCTMLNTQANTSTAAVMRWTKRLFCRHMPQR